MPSAPTPSTSSLPPGEPWMSCPHGPPWEGGDPGFELSPLWAGVGVCWGNRERGGNCSFLVPPSSPFAHCSLPMAGPAHHSAKSCPWLSPAHALVMPWVTPPTQGPPSPSGLGIVCCSRGALQQQDSDILFSTLSLFSLPFSLSLCLSSPPPICATATAG